MPIIVPSPKRQKLSLKQFQKIKAETLPDAQRVRLFMRLKKYIALPPAFEAYKVPTEDGSDLYLVHQIDESTKWKSEYYLYEGNDCVYVNGEIV